MLAQKNSGRCLPGRSYAVTEIGIDGPGQMEQFVQEWFKPDIVIVTCDSE